MDFFSIVIAKRFKQQGSAIKTSREFNIEVDSIQKICDGVKALIESEAAAQKKPVFQFVLMDPDSSEAYLNIKNEYERAEK